MPTAYIKKLAKLNHTTVNKIEKFWSQAKEIAKSEGNGKAWGLITTIFQNKLKKEGYKVKAFTALADVEDKLDYINQVKECIKQIWARSIRSQQEKCVNEWVIKYSRLIDDCINAFEEPKVCARMMYIKYHKENSQTRDLNKNHDTDFYTLLKEAKQYFDGLKKWKEDDELLNELNKQSTASTEVNALKPFLYKKHTIFASCKEEAIKKVIAYTFGNRTVQDVKKYLKHYSPIENKYFSNIYLYKKEITRLLKEDGQFTIIANKHKLSGLCHLCAEAGVSAYDAFRYISNNF